MSGIHNSGFSNNLIYDNCSYQQYLNSNQGQYLYRLDMNPYENVNKCRFDKFYHPYDLVSLESILRNQTRPASNCNMFKHNPNNTGKCISRKEPYQISSIQSNHYNCPSCDGKINYDVQKEEVKKNEGIINNIKNTMGLNKQENFTPEETYNMFFALDPSIKNQVKPVPIVENTYCDSDVNTFDPSVPKVAAPELCPIVHNNIPKRYCNNIIIPEFIQ